MNGASSVGGAAFNASGMRDSKMVAGANTAMAAGNMAMKVGGTAMSVAGVAGSGMSKTASALKAVADSDAYKYLQSKGLDPITLAGNALKNQGGALGAAGGMMVSAANGDSSFQIAKAGVVGSLGPGGAMGAANSAMVMAGLKEAPPPPPTYYERAVNAVKNTAAGYGLISREEIEKEEQKRKEEEEKKNEGYMASAANLASSAMG